MKEKTETENTSFTTFENKKKTEVKKDVVKEEKQEVAKEVKKAEVPEVTKPKEKTIDEMSNAEIEAYLKKRKAEANSFKIVNEDVPMCKLIQGSVAPTPNVNAGEFMRNANYIQNRLLQELDKKKG